MGHLVNLNVLFVAAILVKGGGRVLIVQTLCEKEGGRPEAGGEVGLFGQHKRRKRPLLHLSE